jgi:HSP20 family protein
MERSPFRELARLERDMGEWFDRFPEWPWGERSRAWAPAIDMVDHKDEIVLRADLPGLEEKDIEVTLTDDALTVKAERQVERKDEKKGYFVSERSYGSIYRSIPLPAGVDSDKAEATFRTGVLTVRLPQRPEAKAKVRKVEVKSA